MRPSRTTTALCDASRQGVAPGPAGIGASQVGLGLPGMPPRRTSHTIVVDAGSVGDAPVGQVGLIIPSQGTVSHEHQSAQ